MPASTRLPFLAAAGLLFAAIAHADVTIQEKTSMDLPIFKAIGESTENYAGDRKRHDTALHCQGFMSMFCGNSGSGEIVRLDRSMVYDLEPSKKRYREHPLPTEAGPAPYRHIPPAPQRPAPLPGADTRQVCREVLAMDDTDIEGLITNGVLFSTADAEQRGVPG